MTTFPTSNSSAGESGLIDFIIQNARWKRDGMIFPDLNCWGLVRMARHCLYGLPVLPHFHISAEDKKALTHASGEVIASHLIEIDKPEKGAVVAAWRNNICVHVGLVVEIDGRLAILDIDEKTGAKWQRVDDFKAFYNRVTYYRDKNL